MLIRTIPDSDWSTIDDRALTHPGDIVDLGCAPWNWSRFFIGKKRVIGADPHAEPINGAELFQGVIGAKNTMAKISTDGDSSTVMPCVSRWDHLVKMITWKQFKYDFRISDIAALKVNIEGLEYDLIDQMDDEDFRQIDQIAISFHHRKWPKFSEATNKSLLKLKSARFMLIPTNVPYCWHLALK